MATTTKENGLLITRGKRSSIIEGSPDAKAYNFDSFVIGGGKLKKYTQDTPEQSSPSEKPKRVVIKDEFYHALRKQLSRGMQRKMVPEPDTDDTKKTGPTERSFKP